jgi:hypothetical protein
MGEVARRPRHIRAQGNRVRGMVQITVAFEPELFAEISGIAAKRHEPFVATLSRLARSGLAYQERNPT